MWYACTWTENLLKDTHQSHSFIFLFFPIRLVCFRYARVRVMLAFTVSSRDITSSLTRAHPGRIDDIIHHPPHGLVQQVRILGSGSGYLVVSCSFLFLKTELF